MKKFPILFLALLLAGTNTFAQRKYVGWSTGYYTNWTNTKTYPFSKINWKIYTHVIYFSASPNGNGGALDNGVSATDGKSFTTLAHQNNTKALICVGGAGSGKSYATATTDANRAAFIQNMINLMQQDGFDGIDIDWEENFNTANNAQYLSLFKELRAALDKITPRPLLTCATADYFSNTTAPAAQYMDQVNNMSYWTLVGGMASNMNQFTSKGVPKIKQGVGYGYDTDKEVDVDNPTDIGAKCQFTIDQGFGGIMIWEIARACAKCDDTTGYFVNKSASTAINPIAERMRSTGMSLTISENRELRVIDYAIPAAAVVDLGLYDSKGTLVRNLLHGSREAGAYSLSVDRNQAGLSIRPGAYLIKLDTPAGSKAGTLVMP